MAAAIYQAALADHLISPETTQQAHRQSLAMPTHGKIQPACVRAVTVRPGCLVICAKT